MNTYTGKLLTKHVTHEVSVDKEGLEALGLYLVPGGTVDQKDIEIDGDGNRTIKHFNLSEVSFSHYPADLKLTPIKKKELDG